MSPAIPTQNIYYLLLYAWNRLPEGRTIDVAGITGPALPNLLAKVLLDGLAHLRRRGLDRGYVETDEDLTRPRGRMRLGDTLSRGLLSRAAVACTTDDLSLNVLHNQIIKATLERLAKTAEIESLLLDRLNVAKRELSDVHSIDIAAHDFRRVQLHGNNAFYGLLLRVCALVHEGLIPEPGIGRFRFRNLLADPPTMGRIFQDFVYNFFRLEQRRYAVKSESYGWPVAQGIGHGHHLIPSMNTDVSLIDDNRTIIVECKWTRSTLQTSYGVKTLRSNHLYQLSAYVKNHRRAHMNAATIEGLLLYPLIDDSVDVELSISGQRLRARTINLSCDWRDVNLQLLGLLDDGSPSEIANAGNKLLPHSVNHLNR